MAKPVVDGLERDLQGQARLLRVDRTTALGRELAGRYGLRVVPSLIVFDGWGNVVLLQEGRIDREEVLSGIGGTRGTSGGFTCPATPSPPCEEP